MKKYICPKCLEVIDIREHTWGTVNPAYYDELEETNRKLFNQVESMRELLAANVRVIKAELRKELAEEEQQKQEADNGTPSTPSVVS